MFEILIWLGVAIALGGMLYAYAGSGDVFHPLMFLAPMMIFIYAWMPWKLNQNGGLDQYFQPDQLVFVQALDVAGILCLVLGCLSVGCRFAPVTAPEKLMPNSAGPLITGGTIIGSIGLVAWTISIVNVGGLRDAFSRPYSGGWDDSGYIRDGSLLLFPAVLLIMTVAAQWLRVSYVLLMGAFLAPWTIQAALGTRRGPAFMVSVVLAMGWYMNRRRRPPLLLTAGAGLCLGFLLLFLVTNRGNIYLGSDSGVTTDVSSIAEKPDTGNEYIYGTGSLLSVEQRQQFYWGRRYLAQMLVRPIPTAVWPTKYEDFGVPELMYNAGTGEGFAETLGWTGAAGSAPGLIADLWLEFHWLTFPVLWLVGRLYGLVWRKSHISGGPWITQHVIMAGLSIYLVMQTMEAVLFRFLLMSVPMWFVWSRARRVVPLPAARNPEIIAVEA